MIWFAIPALALVFFLVFFIGFLFGKMAAQQENKEGSEVQNILQETFNGDQPEFYALVVGNERTADISTNKHRIRAKGLEVLAKDENKVVEVITYKPSRREHVK